MSRSSTESFTTGSRAVPRKNLRPDRNDTNSIRKMRKKQFSEKIMQINLITKTTIPMMPTPQDIRHRQREIRQINQDITGKILNKAPYKVTKTQVEKALKSFLGDSLQTVPIYSAVKINGKKLYEYARTNETVTLPTRNIHIYDIELLSFKDDTIKFRVEVSKGTYIRSLIEDIAKALGTLGTMTSLTRTKQGDFSLENAYTIDDILNDNYQEIPLLTVLKDYPVYKLNKNEYFQVKNGVKLSLNRDDKIITMVYNNKPIALYKKDETIYRVYKMLEVAA